ncbi:MAG: hypothetical protein NTX33_09475 [Propionibacteriales bacterium]|nr:hypothetical protein [Propionibacteriales bacterium]
MHLNQLSTQIDRTDTSLTWRSRAALLLAALVAATLLGLGTATPAEATVTSCKDGRCTIYLSQSETRALANGRTPAPPSWTPWQIKGAYYALALGHRWFAQQYARQGKCSAFTLNVRPWATQGYYGYSCNWK